MVENSENYPNFTDREAEIVDLLSRGRSIKEIAEILNISARTVDSHLRNAKQKNGVTKATELFATFIAYKNHKPFNLKNLREYGITILLLFINVCPISNGEF